MIKEIYPLFSSNDQIDQTLGANMYAPHMQYGKEVQFYLKGINICLHVHYSTCGESISMSDMHIYIGFASIGLLANVLLYYLLKLSVKT